ncbi:MAG: PEP-CTERM sorting domain-containing protein [Planctomycetota bacterium]
MNRKTPTFVTRTLVGFLATGMAFAAAQAHAVPITILNNSFETPDVADNTFLETVPDSWTLVNLGGVSFLSDKAFAAANGIAGAQDGDQYVLAGNSGAMLLHQDTALDWSTLSVGDELAVSAWTTYRSDLSAPDFVFWLNDASEPDDGDSPLNSGLIDVTDGGQTAAGVWVQRTWTHVVTQADLDFASANNWGAVNVQLGYVNGADPEQLAFDNVSLEYTPVPEPTSLALIALGGACLFRRRRR